MCRGSIRLYSTVRCTYEYSSKSVRYWHERQAYDNGADGERNWTGRADGLLERTARSRAARRAHVERVAARHSSGGRRGARWRQNSERHPRGARAQTQRALVRLQRAARVTLYCIIQYCIGSSRETQTAGRWVWAKDDWRYGYVRMCRWES